MAIGSMCQKFCKAWIFNFLRKIVIYTSRSYATMSVSVRLSVTEVHWRTIANLFQIPIPLYRALRPPCCL